MLEPVRHRQTKGAATDMFVLPPPRHTPTLPSRAVRRPRSEWPLMARLRSSGGRSDFPVPGLRLTSRWNVGTAAHDPSETLAGCSVTRIELHSHGSLTRRVGWQPSAWGRDIQPVGPPRGAA